MKIFWRITFLLIFLVLLIKLFGKSPSTATGNQSLFPEISLQVENRISTEPPHRVGINLGQWASSGAQQYGRNILLNPGFEGQVERILVIVSEVDGVSFYDEAGLGHPDDYWLQAQYEVKIGKSAGQKGVIIKSLHSGEKGAPQYFTPSPIPELEVNDIVILTKVTRSSHESFWLDGGDGTAEIDPYERRTNSSGSQAMRLISSGGDRAEIRFVMDALSPRSGKMLPVKGPWHFSVWAKAQQPNSHLEVLFQRENSTKPFFRETLPLATEWQEFHVDFEGEDEGPAGAVVLTLAAGESDSTLWIDDAWLGPQQPTSVFREEVVEALKTIRPSFIREFPPLGDTWENRITEPQGRKVWTYFLSDGRKEKIYGYSLPEFLELCTLVGANPWLIIPPTYSDYELREMGAFLAKEATTDRFPEVILEFGNENWNWFFRPAAIPYHTLHGEVAQRAFEQIAKEIGKKVNVKYFINGQYSAPLTAMRFLDEAPKADGIAMAPYFFNTLPRGTPDRQAVQQLFQDDSGLLEE